MLSNKLEQFFQKEYSVGLLLIFAALLAMVTINSPLAHYYDLLLHIPVEINVGTFQIKKPILLWINDGLMALFFLLIGLEVKYEVLRGELNSLSKIALPGIAAIGGMVLPALVFIVFNHEDPKALHGWAIPTATDIAFAIGVLALLGSRLPPSLKIFLLALAIFDDLGAIVVIALFYTSDISVLSIVLAAIFLCILITLNVCKVTRFGPYLFFGVALWLCVLKSGVHATLAGVLIALTIPLNLKNKYGEAPLKVLQHKLHDKVNYLILPIFAFANAGVELTMQEISSLITPIPMGIMLGLFIGKQIGVFGFCYAAVKIGIAKMPTGASWMQVYGLSILCGIGFTMSLFIGTLAFQGSDYMATDRIGILAGSFISALIGYLVLRMSSNSKVINKTV